MSDSMTSLSVCGAGLEGDVSVCRNLFLGGPNAPATGASVEVGSDDGSDVSPLPLPGAALSLTETRCFMSFLTRPGTNRCFSSTFSSPSRIGRRQSRSSFTSSLAGVEDSTSVGALPSDSLLGFEDILANSTFFGFMSSDEVSSDSSFRSRVQTEEVTSHQTVVKSLRMRQTLHVGAKGFRRPVQDTRDRKNTACQLAKHRHFKAYRSIPMNHFR